MQFFDKHPIFSDQAQRVSFKEGPHHGTYTAFFGGQAARFDAATRLPLKPWGYEMFVK